MRHLEDWTTRICKASHGSLGRLDSIKRRERNELHHRILEPMAQPMATLEHEANNRDGGITHDAHA